MIAPVHPTTGSSPRQRGRARSTAVGTSLPVAVRDRLTVGGAVTRAL